MLVTLQNKPEIATENIIVYKLCKFSPESIYAILVKNYKYSKIETARLKTKRYVNTFSIGHGLHSYKNKHLHSYYDNKNLILTIWIIPKGAKYYTSFYGEEYVSNKLIFHQLFDTPFISNDCVDWAKPNPIRFIKKWYRYYFLKNIIGY